jgi:hypothetical protein
MIVGLLKINQKITAKQLNMAAKRILAGAPVTVAA